MPFLDRSRFDGRDIGSLDVDVATWTDYSPDDFDSSTVSTIDSTMFVDLFILNESESAGYVLLRAHGSQADDAFDGAIKVPAGGARSLGCYFPDLDGGDGVTTISVIGTLHLEMVAI